MIGNRNPSFIKTSLIKSLQYGFSLLKQLWVFCKEPPPLPFISPCWIRFWPWDYITDSLFQYRTTESMNRTHSWRTQTLFSSTTAQMYHFFISEEPRTVFGQSLRLGLCFLTESLFIQITVMWSGSIWDYPTQLQELQNGFIIHLTGRWESQWKVCVQIFTSEFVQTL